MRKRNTDWNCSGAMLQKFQILVSRICLFPLVSSFHPMRREKSRKIHLKGHFRLFLVILPFPFSASSLVSSFRLYLFIPSSFVFAFFVPRLSSEFLRRDEHEDEDETKDENVFATLLRWSFQSGLHLRATSAADEHLARYDLSS
jgi:hypothetical protein